MKPTETGSYLLKAGDWLTFLAGIALVGWLFTSLWQGGGADKVIVRKGGQVFAEAPLARNQTLSIPGPLGTSLIEIKNGRARVAQDPSPRQYCVMQGWLTRVGEAAICLPNEVSIELAGAKRPYDSLNY